MLIIYVFGSPLVMFSLVFKNRKKLGHPEVIQYILLLYQGLNHSKFYWEFVNTLRKFILLWIHVFITDRFKIVKALLGAVTMFVCSIMQARLRPYKIEVVSDLGNNLIFTLSILNLIEHREMVSSILTIYGGLIFVQEDNQLSYLRIIIFVGIIIANCRFIIMWIFWVATVYKRYRYISKFAYWVKRAFWIYISEVNFNDYIFRMMKIKCDTDQR